MSYQTQINNKMLQSEKNYHLLENFALYHSGSNEPLYNELIQSINDYIEEDHVDGKPADIKKELKVYVIDTECFGDGEEELFDKNKCSDEMFITLAHEQDNVYTLNDFQKVFNDGEMYIDSDFTYVRFIEIEIPQIN